MIKLLLFSILEMIKAALFSELRAFVFQQTKKGFTVLTTYIDKMFVYFDKVLHEIRYILQNDVIITISIYEIIVIATEISIAGFLTLSYIYFLN